MPLYSQQDMHRSSVTEDPPLWFAHAPLHDNWSNGKPRINGRIEDKETYVVDIKLGFSNPYSIEQG